MKNLQKKKEIVPCFYLNVKGKGCALHSVQCNDSVDGAKSARHSPHHLQRAHRRKKFVSYYRFHAA